MRDYVAASAAVIGALAAFGAAAPVVAASNPQVSVPIPPGDYDRYGIPRLPMPAELAEPGQMPHGPFVPPRADPQHPNPGADEIYPPSSRRLGEQGTVTLLITVNAEGRVTEARVQTSSGNGHLDEVAQKAAARSWHFIPGSVNGRPATLQMPIKVIFK